MDDQIRDVHSCSIPHLAEDLVVQSINRCIAAATGTKWGWGEPLNILNYAPGQQYKPHHDGTGADNVSIRQLTALIWLNDQFEGGETDFPKIKVRVRGSVGDMLVFRMWMTKAGSRAHGACGPAGEKASNGWRTAGSGGRII
jgi:prolyl 4-hydroxylase